MLEQQSNMIQSTTFNQGVFEAIKEGKNVVDKIQAQVNVDEMADLQADLQEQMDKQGEVDDFFADIANDDKDELMDELDELAALDEMDDMALPGVDSIAVKPQPAAQQPAAQVDASADEEAELAAMMAM